MGICGGGELNLTEEGAEEAKRLEDERASIPPIKIDVECDEQPTTQISVRPCEQVGASIARELGLEELGLSVKEVFLGERKLDLREAWERQEVCQQTAITIALRNSTLQAHTDSVSSVAVLPNGDIVTGSQDQTAIIWSTEGEQKQVLQGHTDAVNSVAVFPNGEIVTGSDDNTAIVWTVEGAQKRVLQGHTGRVLVVTVLPYGDIVTGSTDGNAIVWSVPRGRAGQAQSGSEKITLRGHTLYVFAAAGLVDGDIVTGSGDCTAIVWSAQGEQ